MLRIFTFFVGFGFIAFGILGFFPQFLANGRLFDLFRINFEHNILHLSTGVLAVLSAISSHYAAKMYFIFMGGIYLCLALFGFMAADDMLFNMIAINPAVNFLHLGIAVVSLFIGFSTKES